MCDLRENAGDPFGVFPGDVFVAPVERESGAILQTSSVYVAIERGLVIALLRHQSIQSKMGVRKSFRFAFPGIESRTRSTAQFVALVTVFDDRGRLATTRTVCTSNRTSRCRVLQFHVGRAATHVPVHFLSAPGRLLGAFPRLGTPKAWLDRWCRSLAPLLAILPNQVLRLLLQGDGNR